VTHDGDRVLGEHHVGLDGVDAEGEGEFVRRAGVLRTVARSTAMADDERAGVRGHRSRLGASVRRVWSPPLFAQGEPFIAHSQRHPETPEIRSDTLESTAPRCVPTLE